MRTLNDVLKNFYYEYHRTTKSYAGRQKGVVPSIDTTIKTPPIQWRLLLNSLFHAKALGHVQP